METGMLQLELDLGELTTSMFCASLISTIATVSSFAFGCLSCATFQRTTSTTHGICREASARCWSWLLAMSWSKAAKHYTHHSSQFKSIHTLTPCDKPREGIEARSSLTTFQTNLPLNQSNLFLFSFASWGFGVLGFWFFVIDFQFRTMCLVLH